MEVVLKLLRSADKLFTQLRILSSNTGRTGVLLTLSHDGAAHTY